MRFSNKISVLCFSGKQRPRLTKNSVDLATKTAFMIEYYSPLLETMFPEGDANRKLFIEAIVTDDSEYTGRYRVTIDGQIVTELTWREDDVWEETGKGETEQAKLIGEMIASNEE